MLEALIKVVWIFIMTFSVYIIISVPLCFYTCQFSWQSKFGMFLYKHRRVCDFFIGIGLYGFIPYVVFIVIISMWMR